MRTILIPLPVAQLDPFSDAPTGDFLSFSEFARGLFLHPQIAQMGDVLSLMDLRTRVARAKAEERIELDESAWQLLCQLARQPAAIKPIWLPSITPFVRAILDAQAS